MRRNWTEFITIHTLLIGFNCFVKQKAPPEFVALLAIINMACDAYIVVLLLLLFVVTKNLRIH